MDRERVSEHENERKQIKSDKKRSGERERERNGEKKDLKVIYVFYGLNKRNCGRNWTYRKQREGKRKRRQNHERHSHFPHQKERKINIALWYKRYKNIPMKKKTREKIKRNKIEEEKKATNANQIL